MASRGAKKVLWLGPPLQSGLGATLSSSGYQVTSQLGADGPPDLIVVSGGASNGGLTVFAHSPQARAAFEHALQLRGAEPPESADQIMVGQSAAMARLRDVMTKLLATPHTSLLLKGEHGSGKRTFARALHAAGRQGGELVELSDPKQLEALRRDPRRRAPITVYLGDLSRISAPLQSKLQRLVEARRADGEAPIRFVAAVTGDFEAASRRGELRPGLLYRFAVTLEVPALRDRLEDLPLLAQHLLARLADQHGVEPPVLTEQAVAALRQLSWPGNVTELCNTLQAAMLQADGQPIRAEHLPERASSGVKFRLPASGLDLRALEREVLTQALRLARGNRTRAASLLGLTRDQVRYRLTKLDEIDKLTSE